MQYSCRMQSLAAPCRNQNGVTFLMTMFIISIMGIMLGMTGQAWKTIMQREREKELLFRGSQIKEAIENWYTPTYTANGVRFNGGHALIDLKDLLNNPYTLTPLRYLPQHYEIKLDGKNSNCTTDCPELKVYQDPMTGKKWELIKCDISTASNDICKQFQGANIVIGVASKSDAKPFRTDFKDTALENITGELSGTPQGTGIQVLNLGGPSVAGSDLGSNPVAGTANKKPTKYSEWKFVADKKNDHSKIYRAYHEGW